jgi:hypothetical protein
MTHSVDYWLNDTLQVKVDGQPAEMPYRSDRLTIMRSGNTVTLDSTVGLTVISDFSRDYHIVGMSGWYYGKVGGLLGNIDGEQHNDYMNPAGEVEERTRKLLNSWEVDTTCKSTMEFVEEESKRRLPECAAVFNASSSSLRPCFLMVRNLLCTRYFFRFFCCKKLEIPWYEVLHGTPSSLG